MIPEPPEPGLDPYRAPSAKESAIAGMVLGGLTAVLQLFRIFGKLG